MDNKSNNNKSDSKRWEEFVSSFEPMKEECTNYSFSSFGDIDESYLSPQERSDMFKQASDEIRLRIKAIRERKKQDKSKNG